MRWDEIESVYQVIFLMDNGGMSHYYRVETFDGDVLEYTHHMYAGVKQLGEDLQREVARARFPEAADRIDAGKAVKFGDLHVSKEGLRHEGPLPWKDFDELKVEDAVVNIYKRSRKEAWAAIPAAEVPNLGLLERVIEHARTGAR